MASAMRRLNFERDWMNQNTEVSLVGLLSAVMPLKTRSQCKQSCLLAWSHSIRDPPHYF